MNYEEMYKLFSFMLSDSIKSLGDDVESIEEYYGNPNECTMEAYCSSFMDKKGIYNGVIDPECLIIPSSKFALAREAFDTAREEAYQDYLDDKEEEE